ncbi:peptidoglycan binding protein, partial [Listeria ivanovii FSL F6-596]
HTGLVGENYKIDAKEIKNYELVKDASNKIGAYKETPQKVTFIYDKTKQPIKVNPVNPTKPTNPDKPAVKDGKSVNLPSTGDEFPYEVIFTGFLVSAFALFLLRKRRQTHK